MTAKVSPYQLIHLINAGFQHPTIDVSSLPRGPSPRNSGNPAHSPANALLATSPKYPSRASIASGESSPKFLPRSSLLVSPKPGASRRFSAMWGTEPGNGLPGTPHAGRRMSVAWSSDVNNSGAGTNSPSNRRGSLLVAAHHSSMMRARRQSIMQTGDGSVGRTWEAARAGLIEELAKYTQPGHEVLFWCFFCDSVMI